MGLADGLLGPALLALILWVLTGIRDELRAVTTRVGEHDSFITALKAERAIKGG